MSRSLSVLRFIYLQEITRFLTAFYRSGRAAAVPRLQSAFCLLTTTQQASVNPYAFVDRCLTQLMKMFHRMVHDVMNSPVNNSPQDSATLSRKSAVYMWIASITSHQPKFIAKRIAIVIFLLFRNLRYAQVSSHLYFVFALPGGVLNGKLFIVCALSLSAFALCFMKISSVQRLSSDFYAFPPNNITL